MTESPISYGDSAGHSRLDRLEAILLQVAQQQASNTTAIANLTAKVDNLTEDVNSLTGIVMHSIQNAETDRETFIRDSADLGILIKAGRQWQ
ncbi:hypothetical protein H6G04_30095 [Calothrix membranacea FACHB-236]|nr:hypothetical protein [Calothrix membranacea FACHB-236]